MGREVFPCRIASRSGGDWGDSGENRMSKELSTTQNKNQRGTNYGISKKRVKASCASLMTLALMMQPVSTLAENPKSDGAIDQKKVV